MANSAHGSVAVKQDAIKIQGIAVDATSPTDGQVLGYNSSENKAAWVNPPEGGGGGSAELILDYVEDSDQDFTITSNTWTDMTANETFTCEGGLLQVGIAGLMYFADPGGAPHGGTAAKVRLVIDSESDPIYLDFGGGIAGDGQGNNGLDGAVLPVSDLAAGSHTVKMQVRCSQAAHVYLRCASGYETFRMFIIEH